MKTHPGVYVEESPGSVHPITGGATARTAFIGAARRGPLDAPVLVYSAFEYGRVFGEQEPATPLDQAVQAYFLNGGQEAWIVRVEDPAGGAIGFKQVADPELRQQHKGLWAMEQGGPFNLMCIPPFDWDVDVDAETWQAALEYCKSHRAVLLVDPPAAWISAGQAAAEIDALKVRDANAVCYFPRLAVKNAGVARCVAPGGAVAGVYARFDALHGLWRAPAGKLADLRGVEELPNELDKPARDALARAGINPLHRVAEGVYCIWGARTLLGVEGAETEWKYVPVRRLALYMEESLHNSLQWAVFEPNDEPLWARIRQSAEAFLTDLWPMEALQGSTPDPAYFVRCGRDTTTQAELDEGGVNLLVGYAPLKPAEFVILRITLRTAP